MKIEMNARKYTVIDIGLAVWVALLFLLSRGYIFNSGDTVEPLLLVYHALDPSLYASDLYVSAAKDIFTVRYYFVHLIVFLGKYVGVASVCFWGTFLSLFFSTLGLIKVSKLLCEQRWTAYLVPFLLSFIFLNWTIGGNVIQYNLFIPSNVAKAMSIWGFYFLIQKRYLTSAMLIGVAGLFQILVSLQLAILILGFFIIRLQFKSIWVWGLGWFVFVSPMLVPILYRQFGVQVNPKDLTNFYHLLYEFRNPQHYLPHLFPVKDYLKLTILLFGGMMSWVFLAPKSQKFVFTFGGLIILGLLSYTLLLEVFKVDAIGKLQFFKTTLWLNAICVIGISLILEQILSRFVSKPIIVLLAFILPLSWMLKDHVLHQVPIAFDHRSEEQLELSDIHLWAKKHTDLDAVFSTFVRDESFECESQRTVFSMLPPIIHEPWFLEEWYQRFHLQYGVVDTIYDLHKMRQMADQYYDSGLWIGAVEPDYFVMPQGKSFEHTVVVFTTRHFELLQNLKADKKRNK